MSKPSVPSFNLGSRCLAYHGPMLYEAKILRIYEPNKPIVSKENVRTDVELPDELREGPAYFIHYKGWKSTWDEWVNTDRLLLWNEENIRTQKELKQAALAASRREAVTESAARKERERERDRERHHKSGTSRRAGSAEVTDTPVKEEDGIHTRKRRDGELEKEHEFLKRPEISLTIPDVLKAQLVDDWEYVTKDDQLVPLPRHPNVAEILDMFRKEAGGAPSGSADAELLEEVLSGLKLYFDRSLGTLLLYRYERQQYLEIRKKYGETASMSEVYGAEHLLRLFVSLPGLIAQTTMDYQSVNVLRDYLEQFLRFMVAHKDKLFVESYENTSPAYEALSRTV